MAFVFSAFLPRASQRAYCCASVCLHQPAILLHGATPLLSTRDVGAAPGRPGCLRPTPTPPRYGPFGKPRGTYATDTFQHRFATSPWANPVGPTPPAHFNAISLRALGNAPRDLSHRHGSTPSLYEPSGRTRGTYAMGTVQRCLFTSPRINHGGHFAMGTVQRRLSTSPRVSSGRPTLSAHFNAVSLRALGPAPGDLRKRRQ